MSVRVLAIRFQAMGDVVITFPYLNALRRAYPRFEIDFLTREETASIPRSLFLFSRVFAIGGGRSFKRQCLAMFVGLPRLILRHYDVVLDLQNNELSRWVTSALRPGAWSRFDKTSALPAGERTRRTIESAGLGPIDLDTDLQIRDDGSAERLLREAGIRSEHRLVVLNAAGAFPTRNWPLPNYVAFARNWQRLDSRPARFLLLGLPALREKADYLSAALDGSVLDLVGRTTPDEAFALVRKADLVLSEDYGLMHMSWCSGVPTVALFGSSRGDWSRPLGEHSVCLDSSDLDCRFCMEATCRHGDVRCLTRREPGEVVRVAMDLLESPLRPLRTPRC